MIIVTGAASGLGLEAARLAAKAGAAVVLAAGDDQAVRAVCAELGQSGGRVHPVAADAASEAGCDRVARATAARFGRIDSWIEAGGGEAALAHAAKALSLHLGERDEPTALVGFGRRMGRAARGELRQAKGRIAATLIRLPRDWRPDSPAKAAAQAALHAVARPMGSMAVAAKGQRLSTVTAARKHPGVMAGLGVGVLALAGVALWLGRGRLSGAAEAVRPRVARAVRPAVLGAVRRRPLQAAKLAAKHPRQALKIARALR
ncbi:SDR family NAD(P)-dependent oxidoreductase [Phenylobacterium sp.]|uniref:SDR family NAD(P)-dependent oxidoreductase n=1 Tax=Phenylobacterium sp. TaxID=1871053 RepID=UPI0025CD7FD1|nr:SDR family NAD(P)-dependent oxidoreductase [Phenylobacterium sp.]